MSLELAENPPPISPEATPSQRAAITVAKAAGLIMAGQIASRILGFGRDAVTAALFGQSGATDAWFAAQTVPQQVYDLIVGTTITAALIPVFSSHADADDLGELWRIANVVLSVAAILLAGLATIMEVLAPQVMGVTVHFGDPATQALAVTLARIVMPVFVFLGLSGVLQSLLYAMRNFVYSAFCVAALNGAVVASAILFHRQLGVASLSLGMIAGAVLMVLIQLPPLFKLRMRFRPSLDLRHPEIKRIGKLYLPVAAGMVVTIIGVVVDRHLASGTGEGNLSAMQYATKIVQLPLGIIASALGVAILPTLARHATEPGLEHYKVMISRGLKFALLLIVPMTVAVLVLNNQILAVVYQHGQYTAQDRQLTAVALYLYAPQLPFAAVDYLLIAAFYAMRNTLVPALLGVIGVCIYLTVALSLVGRLGFPALVLANTLQNSLHGIILFVLLWRQLGSLRGYTLARSALKLTVAGLAMAVVALALVAALGHVPSLASLKGQLVELVIAGGAGLAVYVGAASAMGVDEMRIARTTIVNRLLPSR